jgi:hypothetical protein
MPAILLPKITLVPLLIYGVTLAGRRWGPAVAGWMSAFPIVARPILLTLTLEQGAAFAATAAEGTLTAVLAILVFTLAYAWIAARRGMGLSTLGALAAYAVAVALLRLVELPLLVRFALVVAGLAITPRLLPLVQPAAAGRCEHSRSARRSCWRSAARWWCSYWLGGLAAWGRPRRAGRNAYFLRSSRLLLGA